MEMMKQRYVNASFLLAGFACLVMVASRLLFAFQGYSPESAVPGWSFMSSLCNPLLFAWTGLLLRYRLKSPRKWLQAILFVLVLFLLYRYCQLLRDGSWWKHNPRLYLASLGIGYLVPGGAIAEAGKRKGIEYGLLLLCAIFCYTACAVVSDRIQYGGMPPELHELEGLMAWLMSSAIPLLAVIVIYFAVMLSFSRYGQWLGGRSWFRGIAVGAAAFAFFLSVRGLFMGMFSRWTILPFLVQPVTVYLIHLLTRPRTSP